MRNLILAVALMLRGCGGGSGAVVPLDERPSAKLSPLSRIHRHNRTEKTDDKDLARAKGVDSDG